MITRDDVKKIAKLAKLSLDEKETERFTREMADILKYVEKLNELDLKNVEATSHAVSVTNVFREDEARQSPVHDKALEQAPSAEQNMFRVPRVIG
ncbi:MAG: Asp-tRNA(Asn)/Glu-tRNA(Gln) amidotransferase subunit GatC [Deltaproteobacteria bacterium]|nr:Asp-tRNA(Asn)/Glu-tRNA(Gln) amidotransferase subunit GatC [Deltaproteobacteria bacterium]